MGEREGKPCPVCGDEECEEWGVCDGDLDDIDRTDSACPECGEYDCIGCD